MALGTISHDVRHGEGVGPIGVDLISMAGDDSYPTGGTESFQDTVRSALGKGNVEVIGVIPQDCGGLVPVYDKANDKLKVFNRSDGAEASAGDLSGTTLNLIVLSR